MPSGNLTELMPLLIGLMIVSGIVILIDIVLLIRWLIYQHKMSNGNFEAIQNQESTDADVEPYLVSSPFARTWSLVHPFLGIQFVIIAANALALIPLFIGMTIITLKGGVAALQDPHALSPYMTPVIIFALFAQNFLFVATVAYCVRKYGSSLKEIGLRMPTLNEVWLGLGLGVVMMLVANGLEIGLNSLLTHYAPQNVQTQLTNMTKSMSAGEMFNGLNSFWARILFIIAGGIAAPIGEEIFFRGLLFNSLKHRLNVPWAIGLSGLIFALIHIGPLAIFIIFPMGALLAYVYHKTNSLWVTILMHAVNNTTAFILAWKFSNPGH